MRKDLALGPRSPFLLMAVLLPLVLTVVLQSAFGTLFAPRLRLALFDPGSSAITAALERPAGLEVAVLQSAETLKRRVEANDFDAGLVLPPGFDEAVRGGQLPRLSLYFAGESYASNRFIIQAMVLDAVRAIGREDAPAEVQLVTFGEEGIPLSLRLVPMLVFYALAMAGIFVPGSSLVEEKERGTLMAVVVSPVKISEVLVAKWALGFSLAWGLSTVTLLLNQALGPRPMEALLVLAVAASLTSMLGLLVGVLSKDSAMLFGLIKGTGLILFTPALFYLFPDWPQWAAQVFPLYWVIEPVWRVSVLGEPVSGVWLELTVALVITTAVLGLALWLSARMKVSTESS